MDNNKIIHSVISLLAVDGKINRPEKQFCKATYIRLGVSPDVVKTAIDQVRQGKISAQISKDAVKRKKIFNLLVRAAAADSEINSQERVVLDEIAVKIKISRRDVKRLIATRLEEAQQAKAALRSTTETMTCPGCAFQQKKGTTECIRCGIIFAKARKRVQRHEDGRHGMRTPAVSSPNTTTRNPGQ